MLTIGPPRSLLLASNFLWEGFLNFKLTLDLFLLSTPIVYFVWVKRKGMTKGKEGGRFTRCPTLCKSV
jgi:hypothetical protein